MKCEIIQFVSNIDIGALILIIALGGWKLFEISNCFSKAIAKRMIDKEKL